MKTLLTLMLVAASLHAQQVSLQKLASLATLDGKTFTNVTVTKVTGAEIRFTHDNGIASLPLTKLPPDLQNLFGYDATLSAVAMQEKQAVQQEVAAAAAVKAGQNKALEEAQRKASGEISAIESKAVAAEVLATSKTAEGCKAVVWLLKAEEVNGRKNFSGQSMTQLVKVNQHAAFIHGLDIASGTVSQQRLFPFTFDTSKSSEYATSASLVWKVKHERAEKKAQELAAKQAADKARRDATAAKRAEESKARRAAQNAAAEDPK